MRSWCVSLGAESAFEGMGRFQAAFGAGRVYSECRVPIFKRQPENLAVGFQAAYLPTAGRCAPAETFAKPVTDGASAARRHFEKSVMLCLISNLATSRRRSILGFRLLLGVLQRFQPENRRLQRS